MQLDNTISAIVTGGASGLGKATATALRQLGVKVAIFDFNPKTGEAVAEEIGAVFCHVDVTSDEMVDAGFAKARAANGQERVLVNCAGGGGPGGKTVSRNRETGEIVRHKAEDFERVLRLNTVGTFRCITGSAAGMLTLDPLNEDGERGAIVNTGSVAAQDGQIGQVNYSAAKAAIAGMTRVLARELGERGIRVNSVAPGAIVTERQKALWAGPADEQRYLEGQCLKFRLAAADVARAVLFLASDEARGITGQTLVVDAGLAQTSAV